MPKAAAGTPKAIGNAMKAKSLGRLRWWCQICEKQCRDDNGFKMHVQSETHLRKALVVADNPSRYIGDASRQFQAEFTRLLFRRHNTKRVRANDVYQEYIRDREHLHMNATQWSTLTQFCKHLGRSGLVTYDEDERGVWIAAIDNSPKALERQQQLLKKDRMTADDETRQRKLISDQILRAKELEAEQPGVQFNAAAEPLDNAESASSISALPLDRSNAPKLQLKFSFGKGFMQSGTDANESTGRQADGPAVLASDVRLDPSASTTLTETTAPTPSQPISAPVESSAHTPSFAITPASSSVMTQGAVSQNPLKRPAPTNVFKRVTQPKRDAVDKSTVSISKPPSQPMSAIESLMHEQEARKLRQNGFAKR